MIVRPPWSPALDLKWHRPRLVWGQRLARLIQAATERGEDASGTFSNGGIVRHSAGSVRALWDDTLSGFPLDRGDTSWFWKAPSPAAYFTTSSLPRCWMTRDDDGKQCQESALDMSFGLCKDHYDELKESSR